MSAALERLTLGGFCRAWDRGPAEPPKSDSSGPIFLPRVAPSLASLEGPAALMSCCSSARGEKQSWGDSKGNSRPRRWW